MPVLGICYGEQAMAQQLGGKVEGGHHREFGRAEVEVTRGHAAVRRRVEEGRALSGVDEPWRPRDQAAARAFAVVGTSPNAPIAMIADEKRKFYATQFHLEVMHTPDGAALLRNFVRKIAGCSGDWTMRAFTEEAIEKIRAPGRQGPRDLRAVRRRRFRRSPPC